MLCSTVLLLLVFSAIKDVEKQKLESSLMLKNQNFKTNNKTKLKLQNPFLRRNHFWEIKIWFRKKKTNRDEIERQICHELWGLMIWAAARLELWRFVTFHFDL
jgi:hypothetical protein